MATASARLSEAGRRKRADLRARQRQRGPAPLASFEDISVDRSVDASMERSVDIDAGEDAVIAKVAPAELNCQKLTLPPVSIQVSKASSSGEDSRATTPENDGGFQEEVGELRAATDELGAPHLPLRKDSVSSAGSELILPVSGRSSRISSFCSTASGRRSVSPYRTMLETSFCGSRPLAPPEEPDGIPEPRLPALASNGHHAPSPLVSPPSRRDSTPQRRQSPPLRAESPPIKHDPEPVRSPALRRASPPVDRRACTLPPHQAPPGEGKRKASLGQNQRKREESLSPAKTPDSPLPRRKSSFSRFLSEAKRELRERSRSRSKSKEREIDGKGSILSIFKRKASHPRKADGEKSPPRSPSLENRLEDEINKVEFKFFDGEPAQTNAPVCNNVAPSDTAERKGPDAPVVQGYGNVMKELNSTLLQRTRPGGEAVPPALPLKSPSRLTRDFGAASVDHDHPRPNPAELGTKVLPSPKLDDKRRNENQTEKVKVNKSPLPLPSKHVESKASGKSGKEVNDRSVEHRPASPPTAAASVAAVEEAAACAADEPDAEVRSIRSTRSVRSSGSDKESSAAERSEPVGPDAEATQLCQADSEEDELPYVPTTLPQERPLQHPIVPIEQRGSELRCTAGVERPRSAKEVTPADLTNYVKEAVYEPPPTSARVKILIPQDSLKLIRTPKRMAMKSWSQFAHEGLQSPRLKRQQRGEATTETTQSGKTPRVSVLETTSSLAEDEDEEDEEEEREVRGVKSPARLSDTPPGTPPGWVRVSDIPEPKKTPRKLSSVSNTTSPKHLDSGQASPASDEKHKNLSRSSSHAVRRQHHHVADDDSRRRSDPTDTPSSRSTPRSHAADCTDCACRLSLTSGSSQDLPTSGSFTQLPRSPVEVREVELKHEEIQTRLGADCGPLHRQTALLAETIEDATLTYFRAVRENSPSAAEERRRSSSTPRKDSYGNVLTVDRPGSRPRLSSTGSAKSRSPSPHKMLIETSFCGRVPVPTPGSFEVDDLVDISHLPSETASLHTDTDSSGRQSQDGCVCRCHSDTSDQDTDRRQEELQERLSVASAASSSSSGPPTCAERMPAGCSEASRSGDAEFLLARPPVPFGMDLDVPSNRSSRVISPPPSWPSSPDEAPAQGV